MESLNSFNFNNKKDDKIPEENQVNENQVNENQIEENEIRENQIDAELTIMEQKKQEVSNLLESVGGIDGIEKTLESMNADKIDELNKKIREAAEEAMSAELEAIDSLCVIELPTMLAAAFTSCLFAVPMPETPAGQMAKAGMIVLSLGAVSVPILYSVHYLINEKKLFSGIGDFIKARREKKKWNKLIAERDELKSAQNE